jgi:hypothetical protein
MSSYKFRRALWGIILSVLERPELSGGYVDPMQRCDCRE